MALAARLCEVEWLPGDHAQAQALYERTVPRLVDDAPGMSPELRLRALLTRWRTGGVALLLARKLGGEVHARHRQRLATGLAAWPEVQGSFLATWR